MCPRWDVPRGRGISQAALKRNLEPKDTWKTSRPTKRARKCVATTSGGSRSRSEVVINSQIVSRSSRGSRGGSCTMRVWSLLLFSFCEVARMFRVCSRSKPFEEGFARRKTSQTRARTNKTKQNQPRRTEFLKTAGSAKKSLVSKVIGPRVA